MNENRFCYIRISGKRLGFCVMLAAFLALPYIAIYGIWMSTAFLFLAPNILNQALFWIPTIGMVVFWSSGFLLGYLGFAFDRLKVSLVAAVLELLALGCGILQYCHTP